MAAGVAGASEEDKSHYAGFRALVSRCIVDICVEADTNKVETMAFAEVLKTEEAREADGFSGFRAVLLVDWGFKNCRRLNPKKVTCEVVASWLCENLSFPDEKSKPTAIVVKHLEAIGKT